MAGGKDGITQEEIDALLFKPGKGRKLAEEIDPGALEVEGSVRDAIPTKGEGDAAAAKEAKEVPAPAKPKTWPGARSIKLPEPGSVPTTEDELLFGEETPVETPTKAVELSKPPVMRKAETPLPKAKFVPSSKVPAKDTEGQLPQVRSEKALLSSKEAKAKKPARPSVLDEDSALLTEELHLPLEQDDHKKGRFSSLVDRAKRLMSRSADDKTGILDPVVINQIADVSQRLHKLESVCDRLNAPPDEEANAAEALRRIEKIEATLEVISESEKASRPALDVDAVMKRLEQLERVVEPKPVVLDEIRGIKEQMAKLAAKLETIVANLQDTPTYSLHQNYDCKACGSHGNVALVVRCTQCGKERLQGWWPEAKPENKTDKKPQPTQQTPKAIKPTPAARPRG